MDIFEYFKLFATPESVTVGVILLVFVLYRTCIMPRLQQLEEYETQLNQKLQHILPPDELASIISNQAPTDKLNALIDAINGVNALVTNHNASRLRLEDIELSLKKNQSNKELTEAHIEIKYLICALYLLVEDISRQLEINKLNKGYVAEATEVYSKMGLLLKAYRKNKHICPDCD